MLIHSFSDRYLGFSHLLTVVNNAAMSMYAHVFRYQLPILLGIDILSLSWIVSGYYKERLYPVALCGAVFCLWQILECDMMRCHWVVNLEASDGVLTLSVSSILTLIFSSLIFEVWSSFQL